jgi:sugar phosphate isomerase/epimerase
MKLALSSAAFAPQLRAGALTQLEWLERCAHAYDVDGVVFALEHFPRRDREYLAQLKKMAVDGGLTVAALEAGEFFASATDDDARAAILTDAALLGAPLLVCPLAPPAEIPAAGYNAAVSAGKLGIRAAKSANVTLAVRNTPGTLGATGDDLKRYSKDIDSAWLRYALDVEAASEADEDVLRKRAVIAYARDMGRLTSFRGFICLQYAGEAPDAELPALLEAARRELFAGSRSS